MFLAGILTLTQLRELPAPVLLYVLPACPVLIWKSRMLRRPALFMAGFLWALLRAEWVISQRLDADLEGNTVVIEGTISGLPESRASGTRFHFIIQALTDQRGRDRHPPGTTRLSWYGRHPVPQPGEQWRFKARLKRPHGFMNPGGFDYEGWLFQQGITATGYILPNAATNKRLTRATGFSIARLRFELRRKLSGYLGMSPAGALGMALAMGERSGLSAAQWQVLTRTGTSHLLAISGLHIGIIAGLAYLLTRWLWPLTGLLLGIATPRAAALISVLCALVYAALSGFAIPTQRALIMLGIVMTLLYFFRRTSMSHVIAMSLALILCLDPFAVLSAGFWLSFSAITVILYCMSHRIGTGAKLWWRWGRIQVCMAVGLLPLLAYLFQQVPLTGALSNCVAVPWISLVSLPLILCGTLLTFISDGAAHIALDLGRHSLEILWLFLETLARFDVVVLHLPVPSWVALIAALAGVLIIMLPSGIPGRWLGTLWLLPLLIATGDHPPPGQFRLTLLDVGQGLAVMVQTHSHTLVFDTGPRYSDSFNAGEDVLLPALRHGLVNRIDMLIQSHGDNDHIGGLASLLAAIPVDRVLTGVPGQVDYPNTSRCVSGQSWDWDGVHLEILHPPPGELFEGNNGSCVLKIRQAGYSALISGDIEKPAERDLIARQRHKLPANLLIAPHHGSMTSSTPEFINAVDPNLVLFAVGYRNRFGFPKQDIISRYRRRGIRILDTARSGAIEVHTGATGIEITGYRHQLRRFWHMAE